MGSPHKEEKVIGGNVDLDLLSLFPQEYARIMGGMERKGKLFKVNNGGERVPNLWLDRGGRRGIYTPSKNDRCNPGGNYPGQVGADYPARIWVDYPA
jgi:hypothetical protein